MLAAWAAGYVGRRFHAGGRGDGALDCWGLVLAVYRDVFDIDLPDPMAGLAPSIETADVALVACSRLPEWQQPTSKAAPGDVVIMRMAGLPLHCGIAVSRTHMLHTLEGVGAIIEPFRGRAWANRLIGIWHHDGMGAANV